MTPSKDRTFVDWLFGSNGLPEAELVSHLGEAHQRIEQMQRALQEQQASRLEELHAIRNSRAESEARLVKRQNELEREHAHARGELLAAKASNEAAQVEIARLTRAATEARAVGVREAEVRRRLNVRCSTLELELDKQRSLLETRSRRESDLDQALQHERAACAEAQAEIAAQRVELRRHEEIVRTLEQSAASGVELLQLQAHDRAQLKAQQTELEQRQRELSVARTEVDRLRLELKRQKLTFEQANLRQQGVVEAERRAWAGWLGDVWGALLSTVGPAAPLALEAAFGKLEPVARATTTEAAEARLRELLSSRSLCRNVTIHEQQQELWLDLEQGPALEGTAAGWLGIVATRYLAAMLERPLRTRRIEQKEGRLAVHALRSSDVPAVGMAERLG
jgi:chromosome segregation ATPase